jgi:hypothetical protein
MMPPLPNIIPTMDAKPSTGHETAGRLPANGKQDESFASLMTLILSPSGFSQPAKTLKHGAPEPGKAHGKTTDAQAGGDPIITADQTVLPDPGVIVPVCPQNSFTPALAPMAAKTDQKNVSAVEGELSAKTAPEIFSTDLKAGSTAEPVKVSSPKAGAKKISGRVVPADLKAPSPDVSPKPKSSGGGPVAPVKMIDDVGTPASSAKALTPEKLNSSDDQNQDTTPASTTKLAASLVPMASPTLTIPEKMAKPADEPAAKSADETTLQPAELQLPEFALKASPVIAATTPITATVQQVVRQAQIESFPAEAGVENIEQPSLDTSGTSIAKEDAAMKKVDKLNKFAGTTEKILPGNTVVLARENNLSARADQPAGNNTAEVSTSGREAIVPFMTTDSVAGSAAIDNRAHTLEHVSEMVVQHAMRLNGSGGDALQVVIKPGAGTQLSLELRRHGDGVEVQAVLQQGDFGHLNQNWPELQQRLEQRGIRLAPLMGDVNFSAGNGGHTFQQKPNQPAEALAEFTPAFSVAGTFARPVAASATAHRGWETWA